MSLHRFVAQGLTQQENKIKDIEKELNRINRIVESRQGSSAMDYYLKQQEGLEKQLTKEQNELQAMKERMNVVE